MQIWNGEQLPDQLPHMFLFVSQWLSRYGRSKFETCHKSDTTLSSCNTAYWSGERHPAEKPEARGGRHITYTTRYAHPTAAPALAPGPYVNNPVTNTATLDMSPLRAHPWRVLTTTIYVLKRRARLSHAFNASPWIHFAPLAACAISRDIAV